MGLRTAVLARCSGVGSEDRHDVRSFDKGSPGVWKGADRGKILVEA
jgi:hypothetical protein